MVFEALREAVNTTHGSLHQAFLSWDKSGTGELSKARLRVGLRACRGADERDVDDFIRALFERSRGEGDGEKVTFNRLFQTFHEGETRFPGPVDVQHPLMPATKASAPKPEKTSSTKTSTLNVRPSGASSSLISPRRQPSSSTKSNVSGVALEAYESPNKTVRRRASSPSRLTELPVERKLDFDEPEVISPSNSNTSRVSNASDSTTRSNTSSSYIPSPSSVRFQQLRRAQTAGPSFGGSPPSTRRVSSPMIDHLESQMFSSRLSPSNRQISTRPPWDHQLPSPQSHHLGQRPRSSGPTDFARNIPVERERLALRGDIQSGDLLQGDSQEKRSNLGGIEYDGGSSKTTSTVFDVILRTELRATLLALATNTGEDPRESLITPSDLRRSIHTVDPTLSRKEVEVLARALLGGSSPQRVKLSKILKALDVL